MQKWGARRMGQKTDTDKGGEIRRVRETTLVWPAWRMVDLINVVVSRSRNGLQFTVSKKMGTLVLQETGFYKQPK